MSARLPDTSSIGGRLKAERLRLRLSQAALAGSAGVAKNTEINWERGCSPGPHAAALAAFAEAGADIHFIITGARFCGAPVRQEALAGVTVRQALAMLDPPDRQRLLLDLLAGEFIA